MNALIIPVYRNEESLVELIDVLRTIDADLGGDLVVTFVVDGSPDNSHRALSVLLKTAGFRSKLILHSRNFGAFAAIRTGLQVTEANYYAVMAADLQEPPSLILDIFHELKSHTADIVIGARESRKDMPVDRMFSGMYWAFYRRFVMKEIPRGGVDIFGCTRQVRDHLASLAEANSSLVGQLFWVGYKRTQVAYQRLERKNGVSSWTFSKKYNYLLDSVFAFTDLPIKVLFAIGAIGICTSVVVGAVILTAKSLGLITVSGYSGIVLMIMFFGAINVLGLGIVGTYAQRAYENTKHRPLSIVAEATQFEGT